MHSHFVYAGSCGLMSACAGGAHRRFTPRKLPVSRDGGLSAILRASARRRSAKKREDGSRDPPEPSSIKGHGCASPYGTTRPTQSSQAATDAARGLYDVRPRKSHWQHDIPAASRTAGRVLLSHKHQRCITCLQQTVDTHMLEELAHAPAARATPKGSSAATGALRRR